ncbi:MAG: c-type cytochrome [Candidatus Kapabacteria bacterium]|jgi:cytochrome c oxidase cbb3-type subunit 3|nr:c-type cytochrome [Candidatus Kapabacteria bacterium]
MAKYQENPMEGHEADGIKEFDNSLPRWWLYGFYFTIFFSVVYMVQYHITGSGQVMRDEYAQEVKEAEAKYKLAGAGGSSAAGARMLTVFKDAENIAAGKKLFTGANLCYTCHREDGGGLVGPNLTDDYWMHGASVDSLVASIEHGYPEKGMLPYGNNAKISDKEIMQIVSYVVSLHGTNPPNPKPLDPEREKKEEWKIQ